MVAFYDSVLFLLLVGLPVSNTYQEMFTKIGKLVIALLVCLSSHEYICYVLPFHNSVIRNYN